MFYTGHNTPIAFEDIPDVILDFYNHNKDLTDVSIIVGTDSQNFHDTKVVTVIAVVSEGRGGRFFYEVTRTPKICGVKEKLHAETQDSLDVAERLVTLLEGDPKYEEMYFACPISIHVDAGNSDKGKTKVLIPELVGWVKACGYDVQIKPESFVASSIADKISK